MINTEKLKGQLETLLEIQVTDITLGLRSADGSSLALRVEFRGGHAEITWNGHDMVMTDDRILYTACQVIRNVIANMKGAQE